MSTVPVDPIVEMLVDGEWRDITPDVRLGSAHSGGGIEIARGRSNESAQTEPTQVSFTLNNGPSKAADTLGETGVYSPRNPLGPYFGLLGRNQPIRIGISRRTDDFNRTETDSWGNLPARVLPDDTQAPTETWTLVSSTATAFDVTPGAATIVAVPGSRMAVFGAFADVEVKARMKTSNLTSEFGLVLRKSASSLDWYSVYVTPGSPDQLRIGKVYDNGGSARAVTVNLSSVTIVAGTWYWIRGQIRGQRIRVKIWEDGDPEPMLWTFRYYDNTAVTEGQIPTSGQVGIIVAQGSATVTVSSVEVNQWRAHAEITELPPRWDLSRRDRWVPMQARGILRRLGQGRKALASAVTRHLSSYLTYGWLPLESTQGTITAGNKAIGGNPGAIRNLSYASADVTKTPGIDGYVTLGEADSSVSMPIIGHSSTGAETLLWFMKMDNAPASDILICTIKANGSQIKQYRIYLQSDSAIRVDCIDSGGTVVDTIAGILFYTTAEAPYGSWIAVTLYAFNSGGNVNWALNWHTPGTDVFYTTGTQVIAGTVGTYLSAVFGSSAAHVTAGGLSLAQVFHYPGDLPFVTDAFARAAYAYNEELATTRFMRLLEDHEISGTTIGYSGTSTEMGPQLPNKLVDLLEDCAAVEDGILVEERDDFALALMTRDALYNQIAIELDIDAGHLSAPLDPTDDDQATRNDVTVTRPSGGFYQSVQTEGPLNINAPEDDPDGVGVYDEAPEINAANDSQLSSMANWRKSKGTMVDPRYPSMRADLTASAYLNDDDLAAVAASLDSGRMIDLINPEVSPDTSGQVIQGYTERLDQYERDLVWVTTPNEVYQVGVVEYTTRLATRYIVVESDFDAGTDTSMTTERTDATKGLWVLPADSPASFPFFIKASGVVLEVTSASGTSDPQTLTITQDPANGIEKTIPAGTPIEVVDPWRVGW